MLLRTPLRYLLTGALTSLAISACDDKGEGISDFSREQEIVCHGRD
mgnify:CR=1 FL=1